MIASTTEASWPAVASSAVSAPLIESDAPWSEWRAYKTQSGFRLVGFNNRYRDQTVALTLRLPWTRPSAAARYRVRDTFTGRDLGEHTIAAGAISLRVPLSRISPAHIDLTPNEIKLKRGKREKRDRLVLGCPGAKTGRFPVDPRHAAE